MKEIVINDIDIAMEHAAFLGFKNIHHIIGIAVPKFEMIKFVHHQLLTNIQAISPSSIDRLTETSIYLNNGSKYYLSSMTQGDRSYRGYRFNKFFTVYEKLSHEVKMALIPCLALDPLSVLYFVKDDRDEN